MTRRQHIVPRGDAWAIRESGSSRVTRVFATQGEAIAHGRELARRQKGELVIHGADGRIREASRYGRDPLAAKR